MIILTIFIIIAIIILCWCISASNAMNRYQVKIGEARSSIDIMLTKRYDTLTQSQAVVSKFVEHENELFGLTKPSAGANIETVKQIAAEQTRAYENLLALGQKYPDVKSSPVFMKLQDQISDENEHFAAAKRAYNMNISEFNQFIVTFPNSIVAGMRGKQQQAFIEEDNIDAKKNIKITF